MVVPGTTWLWLCIIVSSAIGVAGIDAQHGRLRVVEPAPLGGLERGRQHVNLLAVRQAEDAQLGIRPARRPGKPFAMVAVGGTAMGREPARWFARAPQRRRSMRHQSRVPREKADCP
jgi:hypothetical protein